MQNVKPSPTPARTQCECEQNRCPFEHKIHKTKASAHRQHTRNTTSIPNGKCKGMNAEQTKRLEACVDFTFKCMALCAVAVQIAFQYKTDQNTMEIRTDDSIAVNVWMNQIHTKEKLCLHLTVFLFLQFYCHFHYHVSSYRFRFDFAVNAKITKAAWLCSRRENPSIELCRYRRGASWMKYESKAIVRRQKHK